MFCSLILRLPSCALRLTRARSEGRPPEWIRWLTFLGLLQPLQAQILKLVVPFLGRFPGRPHSAFAGGPSLGSLPTPRLALWPQLTPVLMLAASGASVGFLFCKGTVNTGEGDISIFLVFS